MTGRMRTICAHLPKIKTFADIGCDHGYCTQYMFANGLCERAYLSDISEGSLSKAKALLKKEIEQGVCFAVCADGMKGLPERCDCALIAGLGGEEIVRILTEGYLPEKFVLQPMKNAEKVREYLLNHGCKITADYTFFDDGVFYELIAGEKGEENAYSDWELKFGRDNLKELPEAFIQKLGVEREKLRGYLARKGMSEESRNDVLKRLYETEVILNALEDDL